MNITKIYISLLAGAIGLTASAQATVDFATTSVLNRLSKNEMRMATTMSQQQDNTPLIPVSITLDSEDAALSLDVATEARVGDIMFARVTPQQLEQLRADKSVTRISLQRRKRLKLHNARKAGNVDDVHSGDGLSGTSYTGAGVLVGVVDGGFDPNHVAFRTSDQSENRVLGLNIYSENERTGKVTVTRYTPAQLPDFTSDDRQDYHATHVTNIAAGAYMNEISGKSYNGVAPGANIFMSALTTYMDGEIITAIQDIQAVAESNAMPLVVNFSLGDNIGPHDGSDDFGRALNAIAEKVPISIAAGNEADLDIAITKILTESDYTIRTSFTPNSYLKAESSKYQAVGTFQAWSDDDTPFDMNILIVSKTDGSVKNTYKLTTAFQEFTPPSTYYNLNKSYMDGQKGLDANSGRYYAEVYFEMYALSDSWQTYPAIEIIGKPGQTIRVYSDGYYTEFATKNFKGYDSATADGTINNMACGKNVIAVGAYNSNSASYPWCYFSSYGSLADGRTLPHFCAPGYNITSAMSTPYYNAYHETPSATASWNGKNYYFGQMSGTSMATPYSTGATAVLLNIDKNATPAEIREAMIETAVAPAQPHIKWGAGRIDLLAAAKKMAASANGVTGIEADSQEHFIIRPAGSRIYEVYSPACKTPHVSIYSLSGGLVTEETGAENTAEINLSELPKGVYLVTVRLSERVITKKVIL